MRMRARWIVCRGSGVCGRLALQHAGAASRREHGIPLRRHRMVALCVRHLRRSSRATRMRARWIVYRVSGVCGRPALSRMSRMPFWA